MSGDLSIHLSDSLLWFLAGFVAFPLVAAVVAFLWVLGEGA